MGRIAKILLIVVVLLITLATAIIYKGCKDLFSVQEDTVEEQAIIWNISDVTEYKGYWVPCSALNEGVLVEYSIYSKWVLSETDLSIDEWTKEKEKEYEVYWNGVEHAREKGNEGATSFSYYKMYELLNDRVIPRLELYISQEGETGGIVLDNKSMWFYTVDDENKMWNEVYGLLQCNGIECISVEDLMSVEEAVVNDNTFVGLNNYNTGYTDAYYFSIDAESGFITEYHGQYKDAPEIVIIPEMLNGVIVQGIAPEAFYKYHKVNKLKAIVLPDSLKYIGDGAFKGCDVLEKVYISMDIQYIGADSFTGCSRLMEIQIPKSIHEIGSGAFKGCTALERVKIPNGVKLGDNVFETTTEIDYYNGLNN